MGTTITVRDVDPADKSWLKREAKRNGVSMEELIRRIIHEKRERTWAKDLPSIAFRRYFGPERGIELSLGGEYGYEPIEFSAEDENSL